MNFPNSKFEKLFVGTKAIQIEKLQKETESNIGMVRRNDSLYAVVSVRDADMLDNAVDKVKDRINDIMNTTATVQMPKLGFSNAQMEALFVGKKGIAIEKIERETESDIGMESWNDSLYAVVSARGANMLDNALAVAKIKDRINDIMNTTEIVQMPKLGFSNAQFERLFVGAKGIDIETLRTETEFDIWFESWNDTYHAVINVKDADRLGNVVIKVKDRIQYIMDTTETVNVPKMEYSFTEFKALFIGKDGFEIEILENETESDIVLENWNDSPVVVVNVRDADRLDNAVAKVKDRINDIMNTTATVQMPKLGFSNAQIEALLVGTKGIAIEKIERETESDIGMESWNDSLYAVGSVRGADMLDIAVAKVKDRINDIMNTTETVQIPKLGFPNTQFEKLFIGAKGIDIETLRN